MRLSSCEPSNTNYPKENTYSDFSIATFQKSDLVSIVNSHSENLAVKLTANRVIETAGDVGEEDAVWSYYRG